MSHPIYSITAVQQTGPFRLRVHFDDGFSREIDFEGALWGELYEPLLDPRFFAQVQLDPEVHTLVWPNGADFDPATLHDWPEYEAAWKARANGTLILRDGPSR